MNESRHSSSELAQLYRDAIKRHAAEPVGYRVPIAATHRHAEYNPLCGDRVEIALQLRQDCIEAAAFDGEACAICVASASLLCSLAPGQTVPEFWQMGDALRHALGEAVGARLARDRAQSALLQQQHATHAEPGIQEELHPLLGVRPYPSRIRCATLPWIAAQRALENEPASA